MYQRVSCARRRWQRFIRTPSGPQSSKTKGFALARVTGAGESNTYIISQLKVLVYVRNEARKQVD